MDKDTIFSKKISIFGMTFVLFKKKEMTIQEIESACIRITESLNRGALKTAFDALQNLIYASEESVYQEKLEKLQQTYRYMLGYYIEGSDDPMRERIYADMKTGMYELTDRLRHKLLSDISPQTYYTVRRSLSGEQTDLNLMITEARTAYEIEDTNSYEEAVNRLFKTVWATDFLPKKSADIVREALTNECFPLEAKSQIVSALLLGLQSSFDKEKLHLLFDAAVVDDEKTRVRAFIAICLTLYTYRQRTEFYPDIRQRLDALAETTDFKSLLLTIILRFILSRETEKVTHKLQEEIIPEMIKLSPKINPNATWGDFITEFTNDEMNPEWKNDMTSDDKLSKWIQEYGEMQEEGIDVMHSTFIHLKHFPFFREVGNWFLPFSIKHSMLGNKEEIGMATLDTLLQASFMCDSDKYSLFFSLLQIPETHRKMMLDQLDSQIGQMNEQQAQEMKNRQTKAENIISLYIQNLYRFYKLYPRHTDFEDIFNWKLDFHNLNILKPYLSDSETLLQIAEFYLRKGYFEDALTIYEQLIGQGENNEMIYQKTGYCKQMNGDLQGALQEYLRSEMLNPNSKWVIRRIAGCYRALKQPEEALKYLLRYDESEPDNLFVLLNIGHCYLEEKNYNDALKYYFKVDYLYPDSNKAQRAIAWCSFLIGKYDQARNYYRKILEQKPQTQDFLNAGHTEWAVQNIKGAIELYQQAIHTAEDFNRFEQLFDNDIPDLIQAGIKKTEIPLLMDQLRYSM